MSPEVEETFFAVQTASGLEYTLHGPYQGLPNLNQVSQSVNGQVIAKVSRPLEDGVGATITLGVEE